MVTEKTSSGLDEIDAAARQELQHHLPPPPDTLVVYLVATAEMAGILAVNDGPVAWAWWKSTGTKRTRSRVCSAYVSSTYWPSGGGPTFHANLWLPSNRCVAKMRSNSNHIERDEEVETADKGDSDPCTIGFHVIMSLNPIFQWSLSNPYRKLFLMRISMLNSGLQ